MLVITPNEETARQLTGDLQSLLGEEEVVLFPGRGFCLLRWRPAARR